MQGKTNLGPRRPWIKFWLHRRLHPWRGVILEKSQAFFELGCDDLALTGHGPTPASPLFLETGFVPWLFPKFGTYRPVPAQSPDPSRLALGT